MPGFSTGPNQATTTIAAELRRAVARGADEAATALARILAQAAIEEQGGDRALDEATIEALGSAEAVDLVLERLPLPALAALLERVTRRARVSGVEERSPPIRQAVWAVLDLVRRSAVLRRIPSAERAAWAESILAAVDGSDFTVGPLFRGRAELYGSKALFEVTGGRNAGVFSWRRAHSRVESLARMLLSLGPDDVAPVAILSENRIEMALCDLACLTSGLVNVLIPANATDSDVAYILRHCGARSVIVSGAHQLRKVQKARDSAPDVRHVFTLDVLPGPGGDVLPLETLGSRVEQVPRSLARQRGEAVRSRDLATIMYTSGTTGTPKGIPFTHQNIVFKRFARALALPEIGERDVFLCFLPLYHTFGRYLELLGSVFWGATYCFMEGTSAEALVQGMRRHRPTVFISVPKKWIELHEQIARRADPATAPDDELEAATKRVTGGRLSWGLSAAGHLDPDVFRFFHRQGIELMSGFGMTEATGGITMTPPGEYREGSLGLPLPGIEVEIAEDGELLIRGPYVTTGYLDPPDGASGYDARGWLPSGDLMQVDAEGHLRLVDRKKEIYKNVKGETIAPQRVENLFRDFDSVGRVFLVGDHREYNTLLIHPNPECRELDFSRMSPQELRGHFRSLVVSVNKFLAPYERIVDFAVIPRDLDPERGELTPKGTPRRKVVEASFAETIRELYRRARLQVGGVELTLPNWLFQALGITARDVHVEANSVVLPFGGAALAVEARTPTLARIGSCLYHHGEGPLNLGTLFVSPRLWLGNEDLSRFVPLETQPREREGSIEWGGRAAPYEPAPDDLERIEGALTRQDLDLSDLDRAARMLASANDRDALAAVALVERILSLDVGTLAEPSRALLARLAESNSMEVRRRAFCALLPAEREPRLRETLIRFLSTKPCVLDEAAREVLCRLTLPAGHIETLVEVTAQACRMPGDPTTGPLLELLADYGAAHPLCYRRLRAFLVRMSQLAVRAETRRKASRVAKRLQVGFRAWLGGPSCVAVDPEAGREYRWEDVVHFDEAVPAHDRLRLLSALEHTAFLREAVFLFSAGVTVDLSDLAQDGVWVRPLVTRHGKSVYRLTIQTRFHGSFDVAANLNHDLTPDQVLEELHWLILSGEPGGRKPLVEDFGGYWPDQDLWSEEFIAGETLDVAMRRLALPGKSDDRLRQIWPYFAWATLSAYVEFWRRAGGRFEIQDPSPTNVVVPTDDFLTGVRLVSISQRREHRGLLDMMRGFHDEFVAPTEEQYPEISGIVGWPQIFSSVLEAVGEREGVALFRAALRKEVAPAGHEEGAALTGFLAEVERRGYVPMRLFFAAERYRRWSLLSADATPQARARTLQELYDTYGLQGLAANHPEIRVRFFLETVFRDSAEALVLGLEEIVRGLRGGELAGEELIDAVDELRARHHSDEHEEYFLARLSYPYLRPEDAAAFASGDFGGRRQSEIVVTLEDHDRSVFRVRHALSPKEVERLFRLFLAAKLDVRFGLEHRHLVATNERSQIIGGIYYEIGEDGLQAHLEKIVVAERYRRKGVADGLMKEFFNRMRASGVRTVTTGFFRPEYFYRHGFQIEKRHAGLVKQLLSEDPEAADGVSLSRPRG